MRSNLLIGNGINQCSDTKEFSANKIKDRFCNALRKNTQDIQFEELRRLLIESEEVIRSKDDLNIEQIASIVFSFVKERIEKENGVFTGNQDQRLKRIIKKIAIETLFINDDEFIDINIWPQVIVAIYKYQTTFTLNYYEYWDHSNKCVYLHNKINRPKNGSEIDGYEKCIFSPINGIKSKSETLYPSEHLYPAKDLYPMGELLLYEPLKNIKSIDVFGVSPYGDRELIEKIRKINKKEIYIYKIEEHEEELNEWNKLVGDSEYLDSRYFYSN